MQKKFTAVFLCLLMGGLVLAACQTSSPSGSPNAPLSVTVIAPTLGAGYPAPGQNQASYPAPVQPDPTEMPPPAVDVTPDPAMGSVSGALQLLRDGTASPVASQTLYLARVLIGSDGQERAASFNAQTAPRAVTDELGAFLFRNVPPGRYGLVIDIVIESYLLNDPNSGESLLITVTEGEELDLGELVFTDLPLPSQ